MNGLGVSYDMYTSLTSSLCLVSKVHVLTVLTPYISNHI